MFKVQLPLCGESFVSSESRGVLSLSQPTSRQGTTEAKRASAATAAAAAGDKKGERRRASSKGRGHAPLGGALCARETVPLSSSRGRVHSALLLR